MLSIGLLYLGVIWIGLYTKYLTERAQRKAFLETRRSLEMRFKTQKENERQERLLLSVLPSFVAQQGSSINHVVKILCIFDTSPLSWSLSLNEIFVIKWSFA